MYNILNILLVIYKYINKMTGTTEITLNKMKYNLTQDNYDEWYEEFISYLRR